MLTLALWPHTSDIDINIITCIGVNIASVVKHMMGGKIVYYGY